MTRRRGSREAGLVPWVHAASAPVRAEVTVVGGAAHLPAVIARLAEAKVSVWIATANVKELLVEDGRAQPGVRRRIGKGAYRSVLYVLEALAARGVELRMLHGELPSGPFRAEIAQHPALLGGGLDLRRCPRVHAKLVVVDGAWLYLGSANWTGAGLGARGHARRNFELGITSSDDALLDHTQAFFETIWSGRACAGCGLRDECPGPLDELTRAPSPPATPRPRVRATTKAKRPRTT